MTSPTAANAITRIDLPANDVTRIKIRKADMTSQEFKEEMQT
jgi:hypothetical protein